MDKDEFIKRIQKMEELRGDPRFYELLLQIAGLHSRKNHDYAQNSDPLSNLKWCANFGISPFKGVLVRLSDKFSRISQLSSGKEAKVQDETVKDTLMDMSIYALLAIILHEEEV